MADESKDATPLSRNIDLSVGLESVSPVKAKRGSIDLSAGLERDEPSESKMNGIPTKIMSAGLERQVSQECSHQGEEVALSPEQVYALLQSEGDVSASSCEAWEVKASTSPPRYNDLSVLSYIRFITLWLLSGSTGDVSIVNSADILNQLGFSSLDLTEAQAESWEKKVAVGTSVTFFHEIPGGGRKWCTPHLVILDALAPSFYLCIYLSMYIYIYISICLSIHGFLITPLPHQAREEMLPRGRPPLTRPNCWQCSVCRRRRAGTWRRGRERAR